MDPIAPRANTAPLSLPASRTTNWSTGWDLGQAAPVADSLPAQGDTTQTWAGAQTLQNFAMGWSNPNQGNLDIYGAISGVLVNGDRNRAAYKELNDLFLRIPKEYKFSAQQVATVRNQTQGMSNPPTDDQMRQLSSTLRGFGISFNAAGPQTIGTATQVALAEISGVLVNGKKDGVQYKALNQLYLSIPSSYQFSADQANQIRNLTRAMSNPPTEDQLRGLADRLRGFGIQANPNAGRPFGTPTQLLFAEVSGVLISGSKEGVAYKDLNAMYLRASSAQRFTEAQLNQVRNLTAGMSNPPTDAQIRGLVDRLRSFGL